MARHPNVLWFEGMTLDPHHFQQWDRHQQAELDFRARALSGFPWGFAELEWPAEALANGQFELIRCSGLMPDGLAFDLPANGALPGPRRLQDAFPPTSEKLGVYLCLPVDRQEGSNYLLPGADPRRATRFVAETVLFTDLNTGADERSIDVARPSFQIRFETEPLQDFSTMKVAEIVRTGSGGFALDERFIPPVLSITASGVLLRLARRLVELLTAKSAELWRRRQGAAERVEMSTNDVLVLWLQHTVNPYIPVLHHHFASARSHPERLYLSLLALAAQLTLFSTREEVHPRDFPTYNHEALGDCFHAVDAVIRNLLEHAIPEANYLSIPLERKSRGLLAGRIADDRLLQEAQLYLVGTGELSEREAALELPQKLRVASPDMIDAVLRSYTRALTLTYTPRPPVGLPLRPGMQYYRLEKQGPFWDAILRTREVAVFVPAEFPGVEMSLVALRAL